ncbi:1-deoxy-D-xylulose-5-phosphate reductoisomerase [Ammoniphilus sp. CFH 90114]|uniref:1-deoxy-D-xylulose-5-phosphate reductoisomerase n=1 Tax=Ammoniphilus sp. CFH 90114 TaxID=2493665 RepID=UPI00100E55C1|nr:1-deoxy-D-xylulose-5-phosphate reductoisomerase [Ammoniphilus sp. CFH 90114]RXT15148.1 1-deoxy-D-xylulose-5-phosphate reductoisomerase [Ammoniphilus sp. CFH 90114]
MKYISILGSTGSIGKQTLDVISQHPDRFQVMGLAAGANWEELIQQAAQFRPRIVSVGTKELADKVRMHVSQDIRVTYGSQGVLEVATWSQTNFVVSAMVGSAGLAPTLQAIEAGKTIGLANKETLVSAGHIVMRLAEEKKVEILPIDSEHSAIHQCLQGEDRRAIKRLILTASGGSFRDKTREELEGVTVDQALAHPNWKMGAKITIDSATMMNKGLEVIEAHWLFNLPFTQIDSVLHRESIVHSMVEFTDSAIIAQLGTPDMRVPIQYALGDTHRLPLDVPAFDLSQALSLNFAPMNFERYPALRLAYECGEAGGTMPTVLNAANEVMVERFLKGQISFTQIESNIEKVLEKHQRIANPQLEAIWDADHWARREASLV